MMTEYYWGNGKEKGLFTFKRHFGYSEVYDDIEEEVSLMVDKITDFETIENYLSKVVKLHIEFKSSKTVVDLKHLCLLDKLKELIIEDCYNPPLKNVSLLKKLKLEKLEIYGKTLDPTSPHLKQKCKDPRFNHIIGIKTNGNILNYSMKNFDSESSCDNCIVQRIISSDGGKDTYQMICHYFEGNHADELIIRTLTKREFYNAIHHKEEDYDGKYPAKMPVKDEDLIIIVE